MDKIAITHVDSLDNDTVVIDGLDIEAALERTIERGEKKRRQRQIITFASAASSILLVLAVASAIFVYLGQPSNIRTASDDINAETSTTTTTDTTTPTSIPITTPPSTDLPQQSLPVLVPRQSGNQNLCNSVNTIPNPGPGEVSLAPSTQLTTWNPLTQPTFEISTPYDGTITLFAATRTDNPERYSADIKPGYPDHAYLNVSNVFFQFCVEGALVEVEYQSNEAFLVSTVMY